MIWRRRRGGVMRRKGRRGEAQKGGGSRQARGQHIKQPHSCYEAIAGVRPPRYRRQTKPVPYEPACLLLMVVRQVEG